MVTTGIPRARELLNRSYNEVVVRYTCHTAMVWKGVTRARVHGGNPALCFWFNVVSGGSGRAAKWREARRREERKYSVKPCTISRLVCFAAASGYSVVGAMATSSSFAEIWSGVQVEYDAEKRHGAAGAPQQTMAAAAAAVLSPRPSHHAPTKFKFARSQIVWRNVILFAIMHSIAVYGLCLILGGYIYGSTVLFSECTIYHYYHYVSFITRD